MEPRYDIKNINTQVHIYFTENSNVSSDINTILADDYIINNNYKEIKNYIIRLVDVGFLCKDINPDYVIESFDEACAVVVICDNIPNGNIFGFALIQFDEINNLIYISMFSSHAGTRGSGDILMKEIQNICKKLYITKINTMSVKKAITFYEKYGFIKEKFYNTVCEMSRIIL
jgi:hypothetical protein